MRTTTVLASLAAATLLVGTATGSAAAETQTRTDQRGDSIALGASRFGAPAAADIVTLRGTHGDGRLTFRFTLRNLEKTEDNEVNIVAARFVSPGGRDYSASVTQQVGGSGGKDVALARTDGGRTELVECEGLEGRVLRARDRIVVSVPRSCVNNPRSVRFGGVAYGVDDGGAGGIDRAFADDARRNGVFRQTIRLGTRDLDNN